MSSTNPKRGPSVHQLRSFGFVMAVAFSVFGLWPLLFRQQNPRTWALAAGLGVLVVGLAVPAALQPLFRVWMAIGHVLGWVNSRIILGTLYFVMITPIRLILALTGSDPMNRQFDRECDSYRSICKPRAVAHMKHPF